MVPRGVIAEGENLELAEPAPLAGARREQFLADVLTGLGAHIPGIGRVFDEAEELVVGGGFVFARGSGSIGDRASTLHARDRFGVQRRGSYFTVDTGKYSTASWIAKCLAAEIVARGGTMTEEWRPLVTALVPTYNGGAFIIKTLDFMSG